MSNNRFIKISAPPTSAAEAEATREQELEARDLKKQQDRQKALDRLREKEQSFGGKDPAKNLINNFVEKATKQGENAEALRIELEGRAVLIRKLLNQIPEDLVAQYFDEFLFKNEIPWTKASELMELAVSATRAGVKLADALDFVLVHYSQKRNMTLTKDIIESAKELQPKMRSLNIMKILKDALMGNVSSGMNLVAMGPQNVESFVILNELLALATAKPDEDLEQTRIQFQKSLDAFTRTREVDDRYKAIFQMLLSDEFNRAMKRNVQFVTNMFQLSVNDPSMLALRRILVSLKMGEAMRDQLFSDLEQKQTAPGTQAESPGGRTTRSQSNNSFRIAQAKSPNVLSPEAQNAIKPLILKLIDEFTKLQGYVQQKQSLVPNENYSSVISDLKNYVQALKAIETDINNQKLTNDNFNKLFWDSANQYLSKYKRLAPEEMQSQVDFNASKEERERNQLQFQEFMQSTQVQPQQQKAANNNKFIKTSQLSQALSSWGNILKPDSLIDGIIKASGVLTAGSGLANLDVGKAVGGLVFTTLYSNHKAQIEDLKRLGLNAPVRSIGEFESVNAGNNFEKIAESFNQQQEYLKLEQALNNIDNTINNSENNLLQITEANLKTGTGRDSETLAFGNPQEVQKAYNDHRALLEKGLEIAEYFRRFVDGLVAVASNDPKYKDFLQSTGSVDAMKAHINNLVSKYRKQYYEYASAGMIAKNMLQKKLLIQQLKTLIPQLEGYLGAGLNIADLIRIPGGLGERLRNIIDQEKEARDILFASIQGMQQYIEQKKLIKPVYQPQIGTVSPSSSPVSGSGAPTGTSSLTQSKAPKTPSPLVDMAKQWATKQLGPQYSGLINLFANNENENIRLASPSELSKSYTDGFRYSNIIIEAADTFDANPFAITTNTPQYGYYLNLINKAQNLGYLENFINTKETKLQPLEKSELLNMIKRMNHYIGKINDPSTNKSQLRNYINLDTNLNSEQKQTLSNMASGSVQQLMGLSNIAGQIIPQQVQELTKKGLTPQQAIDILSKTTTSAGSTATTQDFLKALSGSFAGTGSTAKTPLQQAGELGGKIGTGTGAGTGVTMTLSGPEEENRQKLNAIFSNLNQSTGLNITVDPQAVEKQPELFLQSLTQQWQEREKAYQSLRNIQYKLLTQPISDLGSLNSLASSPFKFIKTADKNDDLNEKEADQKNIDYVGDYYDELYEESEGSPEFGEAIKHPEKWRKVKTEDIPEQD